MFARVVLVAGVARSGTSWLGQIFDSSPVVHYRFQPLFSYAFKNRLNYESGKSEIEKFFVELFESDDPFLLQTDKRETGQYPCFIKNQSLGALVIKENRYQYLFGRLVSLIDNIKMVCIVRNPCAVIKSWANNPKEFPEGSSLADEWRFGACKNQGREEEFFGFYKWREVSNLYLDLQDKFPQKVMVVNYENLVSDTMSQVENLFEFCGIEMSPQTEKFIVDCNSMSIDTPYSVFKDKSVKDRWRGELPQEIIDEIYIELKGTRLEKFLL
jgi:hypothetical protein